MLSASNCSLGRGQQRSEHSSVHAALQSMQGGRTQGIEGLPPEFYKAFWTEMSGDIVQVLNESCKNLSLPQSSYSSTAKEG